MALEPGTKLGPYEVIAPIGAGGMGEVYKAKDTRLDRTVAIKVLPEHLAESPERKARFEREAKAISQLNHPHICTLYDVGEQDGTDFIVMEYIEGETLAERLKKGALKLDQALEYGIQIADGLDTAHRAGIVHRDLKPGNAMITKSGVKLLDFGLARLVENDDDSDASDAPTRQKDLTAEESIIGTLQYMAPEQLERKMVDARTDIFVFGAVLYEMVTGNRAFEGESQASLIHAIMGVDPPSLQSLEPVTPPALGRIVETCLAKDPDDRWQSTRDLARELRWVKDTGASEASPTSPRREHGIRFLLFGLVACVLLLLAAGIVYWPRPPSPPLTRFRIRPESMGVSAFQSIELSPDGRTIIYISERDGSMQLHRRSLGELESSVIYTDDYIVNPFFSHDGEWVAFAVGDEGGELRKVRLSGGPASPICSYSGAFIGASWGADDTIVFTAAGGLYQVSAIGDEPTLIEASATDALRNLPRRPVFLPGGEGILYTLDDTVAVLPRGSAERKTLMDGSAPRYAASGHLVFERGGSLWAVPFDVDRLEIRGTPALVLENLAVDFSKAHFSIADDGTFAYIPAGADTANSSVWVDRDGNSQAVSESMGAVAGWARLSPDDTRLALEVYNDQGTDIWIHDIGRGTNTRLSRNGRGIDPVWSPNGDAVAFSLSGGDESIYRARADGAGEPEPLVTADGARLRVTSWSTDGRLLTLDALHTGDIWVAPISGGDPVPFVSSPFDEWGARISPDGGFIAYVSDESGQDEIYVEPYPGPGARWTVSVGGGREPVWSRDGDELFYRNRSRLMAVDVRTEPEFHAGTPRELFEGAFEESSSGTYYDVSRDGQRFVMLPRGSAVGSGRHIVVVLNWLHELERLVPTN